MNIDFKYTFIIIRGMIIISGVAGIVHSVIINDMTTARIAACIIVPIWVTTYLAIPSDGYTPLKLLNSNIGLNMLICTILGVIRGLLIIYIKETGFHSRFFFFLLLYRKRYIKNNREG